MEKQFYTVNDLAEIMPIGKTNIYSLVHSKDFPAITVGRRIIIPIDRFNEWLNSSVGKKVDL